MLQKSPLVVAAGMLFFSFWLGSVAHAQLAPFPGTKILGSGPDPVGIGKDVPTQFTFEITLNANNFDPNDSVMDVVPAEFDVVSLAPDCGMAESMEKGGSAGKLYKLAPDLILWDLEGCDPSTAQTLTVTIETDLNPGHAKKGIDYYEPTSCGPLFLNDGAVLIDGAADEDSTEPSNALMIASCPDEGAPDCVDADQDGLSVACGDVEGCEPIPEICDGMDNDCDGTVDNGFGQDTCGLGVCMVTVDMCVEGVPQDCTPGTPGPFELCGDGLGDGLDNDCDGLTDEDCEEPQ